MGAHLCHHLSIESGQIGPLPDKKPTTTDTLTFTLTLLTRTKAKPKLGRIDTLTPTERRTLTELLRARLMLTRSGRARLARLLAKAGENA